MNAANVNTRKRELLAHIRTFSIGFLLTIGGGALAATFNLFQPANGVLVGSSNSYVTTAATTSNIVGLWSGTCNNATYLRGDGSCQTLNLNSEVTGTLPVTNGGTGTTTLSGILKGNGTTAIGSAASSDVYGLWSGTCNNTTYLRGDGSCQTPPGTTVGANPTATIDLSAVNGSASTYMRSDAAPALSQAITPTWTGLHTFTNRVISLSPSIANGFSFSARRIGDTPFISWDTTTGTNLGYMQTIQSSGLMEIKNASTGGNIDLTTTGTGQIVLNGVPRFNSSTATTVGAAGGATALPATPSGYLIVSIAGTSFKIPYYAN